MVGYGFDHRRTLSLHALKTMPHTYDAQFMDYTAHSSRQSARAIVALLRTVLPMSGVLDVGCARGTWLRAWQEAGVADIFGIDGNYVDASTLAIPSEHFRAVNLAQSIDLGRQFDLVQSLEVAEHVPACAADNFIENLVRHSRGMVLFSAAPPGQGGEYHVNEQPYEYWRAKFRARDFHPYDFIRPRIATDKEISFWYRYNTLLYVRKDRAGDLPEQIRSTQVDDALPIPDISPPSFRARKLLVKAMPYRLQHWLARCKARVNRSR